MQPLVVQHAGLSSNWNSIGSTKNAGRENDGPSEPRGMKKQDMKITDQVAGHENDGPSKSQGVKMQDRSIHDKSCLGCDMKLQDIKMQISRGENARHENADH